MFVQNVNQLFSEVIDGQQRISPSKTRSVRRRQTRLERQKELRYEAINHRRFNSWSDGSDNDSSDGYDYHLMSSGDVSPTDITKALMSCQPSPQYETDINRSLNDIFAIIEALKYADIEHFFSDLFVKKMSTFIGSNLCRTLQIKILEMFEHLIQTQDYLDEDMIQSLKSSQIIPKLIYLVESGTEEVVKHTLSLLKHFMNTNALMISVMDCGLIEALTGRAEMLNWKSRQNTSGSLRLNRKQSLLKNNLSVVTQRLLYHISSAAEFLVYVITDDVLRVRCLTPLLLKLITCPDIQVQNSAINVLLGLNNSQTPEIYAFIIENFSQKLFTFVNKNENSIIVSILQLFNQMFGSNPQLITYKGLGNKLIAYIKQILNNSNEYKTVKEVIGFIASVGPIVLMIEQTFGDCIEICHNFLHLLFNAYNNESNSAENRRKAMIEFMSLLSLYSFKQFVNLFQTHYLKLITDLINESIAQNNHQLSLHLVLKVITVLEKGLYSDPDVIQVFSHFLFVEKTQIYEYLTRLSFKTHTGDIHQMAVYLLNKLSFQLSLKTVFNDKSV